jgi:hypothetical protein
MYPILREVATSWQVIAITVALILYLNLVFYVAKAYKRPKFTKMNINLKLKRKKTDVKAPEEAASDSASTDDLGIDDD